MENIEKIAFINEDGSLKSKEEVINQISELYDKIENNELKAANGEIESFSAYFTNREYDFDPTNTLLKFHLLERKLYLNDEITPETGQFFLERIQFWNADDDYCGIPVEERLPIQIYINSPGGDLITTMMIVDLIQNSKTPVYTIVTGIAYSGGFFISIAGHKRYGYRSSSYLFHEGSGSTSGDAHKISQWASYYKNILLKQIKHHVLNTTKIDEETYEKHKKDDWYLDAAKAAKYGIIDSISEDTNGGIYNEQRS